MPAKKHAKAKRKMHWFDNDAKWSVCGMMRWHVQEMNLELSAGVVCKHCTRMTAASAIG